MPLFLLLQSKTKFYRSRRECCLPGSLLGDLRDIFLLATKRNGGGSLGSGWLAWEQVVACPLA